MDKCPKCGAIGNRVKSAARMYQCPKDGAYFDSKGKLYGREVRGGFIDLSLLDSLTKSRYDREVRGGFIKAEGEITMSQMDAIKKLYTRESLLEELARTSSTAVAKKHNVNSGRITYLKRDFEITLEDINRKREELTKKAEFNEELVRLAREGATPEEAKELGIDTEPPAEVAIESKTPAIAKDYYRHGICILTEADDCLKGSCDGCPVVDKYRESQAEAPELEINTDPTPTQVENFFVDTENIVKSDLPPTVYVFDPEKPANEPPENEPDNDIPEGKITEQYYITEGQEKYTKGYPLEEALGKLRTEYSVKQCENIRLIKETRILKEIPFIASMAIAVME